MQGGGHRGKRYLFSFILLGFFIWFLCYLVLQRQRNSKSTEKIDYVEMNNWKGIESPKIAFVFSALGVFENLELFKCLMAMESLSKIASWKGDIYLLIGNTRYVPKKLHQILETGRIHVVKVDEISPSYFLRDSSNEKRMLNKMKILDYVKSSAEAIVYYDCDILFVNQGCVQTMIDNIPQLSPEYPIATNGHCHVGSFIVDKRYSVEALHKWGETLDAALESEEGKKRWIPDFEPFCNLFGNINSTKPQKFLQYHDIYRDQFVYDFNLKPSEVSKCVVHLSNGRCEHAGGAAVHKFVKSLNLVSYRDAHRSYCPSVLRRKIKTSGINWSVLQYLPFILDNYEVKDPDR